MEAGALHLDITSTSNPLIKWARSLHQARGRRKHGVIIVEGPKEISYAIEAGLQLKTLFVAPEIFGNHTLPSAEKTLSISHACFERIAYRGDSGGMVGIFIRPERTLADFRLSHNPLILILEAVEKPGNLGAALRVADGAGADGVIVCDEHTDIWNPNAIRASVGTIFSTQMAAASNQAAYDFLQAHGITPFAAEVTNDATTYTQADFTTPSAIILGTEQADVSDFWLQRAQAICLPMLGRNSSLNVSTAAAAIAYEARRQRDTSV